MANQRDSILDAAIQARNDGRWLTRKQFWLLRSRGIDPLGPSDDEQSTQGGWIRWRDRIKGLTARNYPFAGVGAKESNVLASTSKGLSKPDR